MKFEFAFGFIVMFLGWVVVKVNMLCDHDPYIKLVVGLYLVSQGEEIRVCGGLERGLSRREVINADIHHV